MSDHNKMLIDRIKGMPAQPGDLSEEIGWLLQEIDAQKAEIDRLQAENADLKEKVTALEHVIGRYQIHPRHRAPDPPKETE